MKDRDELAGSEPTVYETRLPGIGIRYEFSTRSGERVGVVHHRTGQRELVLYEAEDPDCVARVVELEESDSRTLAELLGIAKVAEQLAQLQQSVRGLAIDRLDISPGSAFAGKAIADTAARTRTGTSIVAVLRASGPIPAPGPELILEPGDNLVVVGTPAGIKALAGILGSL